MKFLMDAHLPPGLCGPLRGAGDDSAHVVQIAKRIGIHRILGYDPAMNATVERLAGELRRLPPVELHELWQHIGFTPVSASPVTADQRAALEAVHSLYGRFAGGNMLARLLQERARDRAREDEQLHRSRSNG